MPSLWNRQGDITLVFWETRQADGQHHNTMALMRRTDGGQVPLLLACCLSQLKTNYWRRMAGYVNYQLAVEEQSSSVVALHDVGVVRTVENFFNEKERPKKAKKMDFIEKDAR